MLRSLSFLIMAAAVTLCCGGCSASKPEEIKVPEGAWLPGGETTNTRLLGPNAFLRPAPNLTAEQDLAFYSGNAFFNQAWVEAPASTTARDGLGPFFNARSCSGCHFRDGKGEPPEDGKAPFSGLLLRLSVPGEDGPVAHPVYGGQLQDIAGSGVLVEAVPSITWSEIPGTYEDGTAYSLLKPEYKIDSENYGELGDDLMISPRIAPHMIGLGLLEAIPVSRLEELADESDADGDGISGKVQWHDSESGKIPGRFGWKADAPTIEIQVANAFADDMGLTSALRPADDCSETQVECRAAITGGEPEVDAKVFSRVKAYSRTISVPVRREADNENVLTGQVLFAQVGCDGCHTPSHRTGEVDIAALSNQLIWPYTDLLLHDMGPGLADNRPLGAASPQEWKTPPLWGLGLMKAVTGHTRFLHDGRARNLEEAILWHGGEAETSLGKFKKLAVEERTALIAFLEDL